MDKKTEIIDGIKYRFNTIPAYYAQEFLESGFGETRDTFNESDILFLLSHVEIRHDGQYILLEDEDIIDELLPDWQAVDKVASTAYDYNYSFLRGWKTWRVPNPDGFVPVAPKNLNSFIHSLIANEYATLVELKTVCSLKDAFEMHDSMMTKAMNEYRYSKLKGL